LTKIIGLDWIRHLCRRYHNHTNRTSREIIIEDTEDSFHCTSAGISQIIIIIIIIIIQRSNNTAKSKTTETRKWQIIIERRRSQRQQWQWRLQDSNNIQELWRRRCQIKELGIDQKREKTKIQISPAVTSPHGTTSGTPTISATSTATATASGRSPRRRRGRHGRDNFSSDRDE